MRTNLHTYVLDNFNLAELTHSVILNHSAELPSTEKRGFFDIVPEAIDVDYGIFKIPAAYTDFVKVVLRQNKTSVILSCECGAPERKLCPHQIQLLYNILRYKDLRAFFDQPLRHEKIRQAAADYGMENEPEPDRFFALELAGKELLIKPRLKELIPVNAASVAQLETRLMPAAPPELPGEKAVAENRKMIAVLGQNKYYDHFFLELYDAPTTRDGKLKNPLVPLNALEMMWDEADTSVVKFYSAVASFSNNFRNSKTSTDLAGLKSVVRNPLEIDFYYHNSSISENISVASLVPVRMERTEMEPQLMIDQKNQFFQISGELLLNGVALDLETITIRFDYFVLHQDALHLIGSEDTLKIVSFFRQHNQKIMVHASKFEEFRTQLLSRLENRIRITYSYLRPATPRQLEEQGFNDEREKIIYLEETGQYILITPVIRYGPVEVPVFSEKQIYAIDGHGNPFVVARQDAEEVRFISILRRQHPDFEEQNEGRNFFYLHKTRFLSEDWFPMIFEEWQEEDIRILGFNKIMKQRFNLNKARVSVHVISGINWFNTTANVFFGNQKVTLKHLHKAVKNHTRYVQLDDGTTGMLPAQWLEKFAGFFEAGEIAGETIRTPRIAFQSVAEMYDAEMLDKEVRDEIRFLQTRFADFDAIHETKVPAELAASLRHYQQEGLNWLNFLDDFGFGGCLADDMGLGKTVQVIAFLLSQRAKVKQNTNLIIVPTSLIFNWQGEMEKFAPSMKVLTVYGPGRVTDVHEFDRYEVILTSYGTLLSDVNFLKKYRFNYIILDESQAIKNPESQRYKAARLLQSRNRLVLTGTPVENNTFDLYGQLSFACPGLLGTKTQFRNHFSMPIDRFKDNARAMELQKRINPFILRRTKRQVAKELPEKTEMVLYCEMGDEQRKVYNAYELEFFNYLNGTQEIDIPRKSLHILQGLTKLRQICDSPALLNDHLYYGNASAKIDVLMEQIGSKAGEHKILVFSQFVSMLDLIRDELVRSGIQFEYLTGQTKDRAAIVDRFQREQSVRVFLISLKAGGTGLNLTEADYVYLIDPWWNPAVENQAIDRSYRIGQHKNVIAVRLICPDTIEEKIMELQKTKKELAEDLVKTDTSILKSLSRSDLLSLVGR
ncbi:DEAD/DEAH box helicase [Dyadobacter sandarakinus]|uniref:DEAD/DEAH box helicase n=1 Tax=Dyadobacter sandarakinus TaxID=2747268 RepID=A0ABX7IGL0_9BACT|nr:DEAD/DEAH box helicase [Dyadobacter sandarakinus]